MRNSPVTALLLAACVSPPADSGNDSGLVSSGDIMILAAPCDGGSSSDRTATFVLPASFNPADGDTILASVCATSCADAGEVCQPAQVEEIVGGNQSAVIPTGSLVTIECYSAFAACTGAEAYLQIIE